MKKALHHFEALEGLVCRARSSDEQVLQRLYDTLLRRFLPLALSFLKDPHEAQTALNDAFMKLQTQLGEGFAWQGEAQFYTYFKVIVQNECRNRYRANKRRLEWEAEHLMSPAPAEGDGEAMVEYIEVAVGYDPAIEEVHVQRSKRVLEETERYLQNVLTPQDLRFWEGYRALTETPGSHEWGDHEKTAFLKKYLGLPESAFYPAHTRFKQRVEPLARRLGLLR